MSFIIIFQTIILGGETSIEVAWNAVKNTDQYLLQLCPIGVPEKKKKPEKAEEKEKSEIKTPIAKPTEPTAKPADEKPTTTAEKPEKKEETKPSEKEEQSKVNEDKKTPEIEKITPESESKTTETEKKPDEKMEVKIEKEEKPKVTEEKENKVDENEKPEKEEKKTEEKDKPVEKPTAEKTPDVKSEKENEPEKMEVDGEKEKKKDEKPVPVTLPVLPLQLPIKLPTPPEPVKLVEPPPKPLEPVKPIEQPVEPKKEEDDGGATPTRDEAEDKMDTTPPPSEPVKAPEVVKAPEKAPEPVKPTEEATKAPETTKVPETSKVPEASKAPEPVKPVESEKPKENEKPKAPEGPQWFDVSMIPSVAQPRHEIKWYYVESDTKTEDDDCVFLDNEKYWKKQMLSSGITYRVRVCAINSCGRSVFSDHSAYKTTVPGFPRAPTSIKVTKTDDGASLSWSPPVNTEIIEYSVYLAVKQSQATGKTNNFVRVYLGHQPNCIVSHSQLAQVSYFRETIHYRVVLIADSDKLSRQNRYLRPRVSGLSSFECDKSTRTRHGDTLKLTL